MKSKILIAGQEGMVGRSIYNLLKKRGLKIIDCKRKDLDFTNQLSVDKWFEKHNEDIDIGRICMFNVFGKEYEIDILPDIMEKAIYKKCIKIIISLMSTSLST